MARSNKGLRVVWSCVRMCFHVAWVSSRENFSFNFFEIKTETKIISVEKPATRLPLTSSVKPNDEDFELKRQKMLCRSQHNHTWRWLSSHASAQSSTSLSRNHDKYQQWQVEAIVPFPRPPLSTSREESHWKQHEISQIFRRHLRSRLRSSIFKFFLIFLSRLTQSPSAEKKKPRVSLLVDHVAISSKRKRVLVQQSTFLEHRFPRNLRQSLIGDLFRVD